VSTDGHIPLAPGRFKVTLVNTRFKYRAEVEITIKAGEVTTQTVELPMGSIVVNTTQGAEIFIDGDRAGSAPLGPIPVAIGAREVLVRHVDLGERRQTVEVTPGKPMELNVVFEGAGAPRTPPRLAPLSMPPERRRR
jgi:hypothetical protein